MDDFFVFLARGRVAGVPRPRAAQPLSHLRAWRNRTWTFLIIPCETAYKEVYEKTATLSSPEVWFCVCTYTYLCDLHTNLCLVTHLLMCLIFHHECRLSLSVDQCWETARGQHRGASGFYYSILFCLKDKPVKSSIIIVCLSSFILTGFKSLCSTRHVIKIALVLATHLFKCFLP